MADEIEGAFERHYIRTSDQPDAFQSRMQADRESTYEWEREGEQVVYAIMDCARIPEEAACDIQEILEERHGDMESAQMGEETEFDSDSRYEPKGPDSSRWDSEWREFERALREEARFFSRSATKLLTSVFDGIGTMKTRKGQPVLVDGGPGTDWP